MPSPKTVTLKLEIPAGLYARIQAAAAARCITPEMFLITMAAWHAPAQDREIEQLKARVRELVAARAAGGAA